MESRLGELCNRAQPDNPRGSRAPSDDPGCHPAHPVSSDTPLPRTGLAFSGDINPAECGGAPPTTRLGDLCGSTVRMIADEEDACRLPRPCQVQLDLVSCWHGHPEQHIPCCQRWLSHGSSIGLPLWSVGTGP